MSSHYSDPTGSRAIGQAEREWKKMARLAVMIREGRDTARFLHGRPMPPFTGIFHRLLTDPIEDVRAEAGYRNSQP